MNKHIWVASTFQSRIVLQATNCLIHSPLQMPIPQHSTIFRKSVARRAWKLTTILVTMVADGSMNAPDMLGILLVLWPEKASHSNCFYQTSKSQAGKPKAILHTSLPSLGPICRPAVLAGRGHLLGEARPIATLFLPWAVPNTLRKS